MMISSRFVCILLFRLRIISVITEFYFVFFVFFVEATRNDVLFLLFSFLFFFSHREKIVRRNEGPSTKLNLLNKCHDANGRNVQRCFIIS